MDRKDIGSWLLGPRAALEQQGIELGYPGQRLGMPEYGLGSVAKFGRRILAICIDWLAANLIVLGLFVDVKYGTSEYSVATLIVFASQVLLLTTTLGASFGQQIVGIGVRNITGQKLTLLAVLVRTLLVTLVIPAIIWDRDGRGLHDKAAKSVVVRTR